MNRCGKRNGERGRRALGQRETALDPVHGDRVSRRQTTRWATRWLLFLRMEIHVLPPPDVRVAVILPFY